MRKASKHVQPYPPGFRAEAIRLVRTSGKPRSEIARDLGLTSETLRIWVKLADLDAGLACACPLRPRTVVARCATGKTYTGRPRFVGNQLGGCPCVGWGSGWQAPGDKTDAVQPRRVRPPDVGTSSVRPHEVAPGFGCPAGEHIFDITPILSIYKSPNQRLVLFYSHAVLSFPNSQENRRFPTGALEKSYAQLWLSMVL